MNTVAAPDESKPLLLFVDDEQRVLNSMRIMFRKDYRLMLTTNGAEALDIVRQHPVDVVVSDQRMPRMSGVEVLSQVKTLSPRTVRILLTGYSDLDAIENSINEGEVFRFLTKPCAPRELRETVRIAAEAAGEPLPETVMPAPAVTASAPMPAPAPASAPVQADTAGDTARLPTPTFPSATDEADDAPGETIVLSGDDIAHVDTTRAARGVLVLSADDQLVAAASDALGEHFQVHGASNVVQAIRLLTEHRPGVLVTDISTDPETFRGLTATLKRHLPELVSVVVSEHRDVEDMVSLINEGQAFRFLRKPLSAGRCLISVQAAMNKHDHLLRHPELMKRHQVVAAAEPTDTGLFGGLMEKLSGIKRFWASGARP